MAKFFAQLTGSLALTGDSYFSSVLWHVWTCKKQLKIRVISTCNQLLCTPAIWLIHKPSYCMQSHDKKSNTAPSKHPPQPEQAEPKTWVPWLSLLSHQTTKAKSCIFSFLLIYRGGAQLTYIQSAWCPIIHSLSVGRAQEGNSHIIIKFASLHSAPSPTDCFQQSFNNPGVSSNLFV